MSTLTKTKSGSTLSLGKKCPRQNYYRLASESSRASEEDTESVYSIQDRETDVIHDTSDTDTKSNCSSRDDQYRLEIEFEVASLSEEDSYNSSTSCSLDMYLAAEAVAGVIFDNNSMEAVVTDCEDSDNSSIESSLKPRTGFSICLQCKFRNENPVFRYCDKCFQSCRQCKIRKTLKCFPVCNSCYKERKKFLPPRPKRKKRNSKKTRRGTPVKLDTLRSALRGLSQDSGLGSSQECPPLDLHQIIVPPHLTPGTSSYERTSSMDEMAKVAYSDMGSFESITGNRSPFDSGLETLTSGSSNVDKKDLVIGEDQYWGSFSSVDTNSEDKGNDLEERETRKRRFSESSLSDYEISKKAKIDCAKSSNSNLENIIEEPTDINSEIGSLAKHTEMEDNINHSDLCIFCNDAPKDSIFLHTNIAHMCCCYKCAKRILNTTRRCPICNRSVNRVVKIFTS